MHTAGLADMTPKDRKFLDTSIDAQLAFWALRDEVPGTLPVMFMLIARNPGIRPTELSDKALAKIPGDKEAGYGQANVSKILRILINELELVQMEHDPKDWRIRRYSLTAKGEKFLKTILPPG